jgi:DNA-binding NtrC family response regulator
MLFRHFLNGRKPAHPISESDLAQMPWLGNVRELRNFVERAAIGATAEAHPFDPAGSAGSEGLAGVAFEQPFKEFRERWIEQGEREYLRRLLDRHDRNVAGAAEQAGLDRTYVYRLIRKHGL